MILYHGSNMVVDFPRLVKQTRFLDFGPGFYTTENNAQAVSFAEKVFRRRYTGAQTVSIYEFDAEIAYADCTYLHFDKPDKVWLDYVFQNRTGTYSGSSFDLIYGPVANDDVYETLNLYTSGVLNKTETLMRLKIKTLFNQMVFASDRALSYLRFIGILGLEVDNEQR